MNQTQFKFPITTCPLRALVTVAILFALGSNVNAKNDWYLKGAIASSRYSPSITSPNYNFGSFGRDVSADRIGVSKRDQNGLSILFGRRLFSHKSFSFSLGTGFVSAPDIGFNSIPLTAEFRFYSPFRFEKVSPFLFAEAGASYLFTNPEEPSTPEKTFLDDFAIDRQPLGERQTPSESEIGANFALGLGVQRAINQSISYEISFSGRMQYLPTRVTFSPKRDFPGLTLPLGETPENNSFQEPRTLTSLEIAFGLRF